MKTIDGPKNTVHCADCLEFMSTMSDSSIDLIVTSPPYDNVRTYGGDLVWGERVWEPIIRELFRITKQGGVVVWVVGDATINGSEIGASFKQALCFKEVGFNLHDTMLYRKENPMPLNHRRYEQEFEYMFVFSKGKPKTVNLITIPCKYAGKTVTGTARNNGRDTLSKKHGVGKLYKETKPLGNIWTYAVGVERQKTIHPAVFPEQLAYDHIVSWSNENDIVLDCFAGSGTVGKVAKQLNRNYVLIEKEEAYCEIIKERLGAI